MRAMAIDIQYVGVMFVDKVKLAGDQRCLGFWLGKGDSAIIWLGKRSTSRAVVRSSGLLCTWEACIFFSSGIVIISGERCDFLAKGCGVGRRGVVGVPMKQHLGLRQIKGIRVWWPCKWGRSCLGAEGDGRRCSCLWKRGRLVSDCGCEVMRVVKVEDSWSELGCVLKS